MQHLGFDRFAIAGHDRGSYTAFRTAMDHPSAVTHLIVLDGVPILEALERCDARFATEHPLIYPHGSSLVSLPLST